MATHEDLSFLKKRVQELEKQLDNLRLSRRVLMDLLEQVEKEKKSLYSQLEKREKHLKRIRRNDHHIGYRPVLQLYEFKDYLKEK